ncbi:putative Ubiquitin 3 binding protein But2 C-terminal domain-containing protein [Seiridium cardinale]|uniref:Ubiquitin 3 binding protein But2 C-terminal domain-containing protein n=1 Tax=Seiridium cardinale TaxID=138064 RepID=A0ABR2X7W3_9PEZI
MFDALVAAKPGIFLQSPISQMSQTTAITVLEERVPNSSIVDSHNVTYGPVPKAEQLFHVEFLEIAPFPIPVDRIVFVYLRGCVNNETGLDQASLRITLQAKLASGEEQEPRTYKIPLVTAAWGHTHLSIRNAEGVHERKLSPGQNDVLTDYWIPGMFIRTGAWTFHVEAVLPDGRYLFGFKLTQWLQGWPT